MTIKTSVNHTPKIFSQYKDVLQGDILNFGCGLYPENVKLSNSKITNYDPNNLEMDGVISNWDEIKSNYDNIVCANVLNVIEKDESINSIIDQIVSKVKKGTVVYFSIYEGDRSGNGRKTSRGYQRNKKAIHYLPWFSDFEKVERKGNIFICQHTVDTKLGNIC